MRWNDNLEGTPLRIAATEHSPLRVIAGPGTGKTFSLMRRVARLVQDGAQPDRVLVSTFTRTAARDLQAEVRGLGIEGSDSVRAGTLHSLCFGVLSRAEVLPLTRRVARPLLAFEERFLVQDLTGGTFGGIRDCRKRLKAFNAAWARLQTDEPGWPSDPIDQAFHRLMESWLRFHEAMLIGEIVPVTLRFLRENPMSDFRDAFDHVVVDEYQDLNRAEQELLDLLSSRGTLTVVGDEDQSIYSFKYAHPEGIATFDRTHADTLDERLEECRRCPQLVVDMANRLISNNTGREPRSLQPLPGSAIGEVHVVQWKTVKEEAAGIARFIHDRVTTQRVEAGRVLVLAARRQFGYAIRKALNDIGTPAHSFFHEEALEGDPKDLLKCRAQQDFCLLTLLANRDDRVALRCWCGFGSNSLRPGAWARLRAYCEASGETPRQALERLSVGELQIRNTSDLVERYRELERRLADLAGKEGVALLDALFPTNKDWAEPFRTAASSLESEDFDARDLRECLRTAISQPELPLDVDYVRVMSLYKSKGLTADLVVVVGCVEGLIPSLDDRLPPTEGEQMLEEQRRLFYVVLTRTRETLVLSSVTRLPRDLAHRMGARVRPGFTNWADAIASRFLTELGPSRPRAVRGSEFLERTITASSS